MPPKKKKIDFAVGTVSAEEREQGRHYVVIPFESADDAREDFLESGYIGIITDDPAIAGAYERVRRYEVASWT